MTAVNYVAPRKYGIGDPVGPGYVYRAFDADGDLLYIGSTGSVQKRLRQHLNSGSPWLHLFAEFHIQPYDKLMHARKAEQRAIKAERPRFNVDMSTLSYRLFATRQLPLICQRGGAA